MALRALLRFLRNARGATITRVVTSKLAPRLRSVICNGRICLWQTLPLQSSNLSYDDGKRAPPTDVGDALLPLLCHLCRTFAVPASRFAPLARLRSATAATRSHTLLLPLAARVRTPSRDGGNRRDRVAPTTTEKGHHPRMWVMPFFWRSRRDLNSRDGFPPYALSRGASSANLSTTP